VTITEVFQAIVARHGKAILILDEIQILAIARGAKAASNKAFLGALRTALDMNKESVRAIFNGSSQNGLRMMLGDTGQALYRYATPFAFPALGDDFVRHLVTLLIRVTTGPHTIVADPNRFIALFATEMGSCPYFARKVVEKLLLFPSLSLDDAWKLAQSDERGSGAGAWASLTGLQKAILIFIAKGGAKPFSKKGLDVLSKAVGVPLEVPTVQSALGSLSNGKGAKGAGEILVNAERGVYCFQDETFRSIVEQESL
jgi:uncharacterized protein